MRDFLAGVALLAFLFVSTAAFIALFKPLPRLYMGTRKRALAGFGVAFALVVLAAIIIPPVETTGEKGAAGQVVAKADERADDGKPGLTAKADMVAYYHKFMDAVETCDRAGTVVAEASKSGDPVSAYQAADRMESACLSTSGEIKDIDIPKSAGAEVKKELAETIKACESAYINKWSAAGLMKKALDNAGSVSTQAELRDTVQAFQGRTLVCVAGLVSAAMKVGATEDDLKRT